MIGNEENIARNVKQEIKNIKQSIKDSVERINYLVGCLEFPPQSQQEKYNLHCFYDDNLCFDFHQILKFQHVNPETNHFWINSINIRYNWLSQFLEDQTVTIFGIYQKCRVIIKDFSQQNNNFGIQFQNGQKNRISSQALYKQNLELTLEFHQHQYAYHFLDSIGYIQVNQRLRVILSCENHQELNKQQSEIYRIIVVRTQQNHNNSTTYKFFQGKYQNYQFQWPLKLQKGNYIIYSTQKNTNLTMISNEPILVKKCEKNALLQYNLLLGCFEQCTEIQRQPTLEFLRVNYMDVGIVIQIYNNVYWQSVQIVNKIVRHQDIKLMFDELYDQRQVQGRKLQGNETIIKFYGLTKIPAELYLPQKKIIKNRQEIQCTSVHTIFK